MAKLSKSEFARLLAFRTDLRRFERWSERQARTVGLSPAQHQLMLAVKGHDDRRGPTVGELAEYLLLRPHSAVELVDRAEVAGLVVRQKTDADGRVVRVGLTSDGESRLNALSALHLAELQRLAPSLKHLVEGLDAESSA
ncbi:MAG: MarR family winged helix-turn-helix transcriptional regulator [Acidothermaceae bacterium]